MKSSKYDANGNRIAPYKSIHKSRRRNMRSVKDNNGFYILQKRVQSVQFPNQWYWKEVK